MGSEFFWFLDLMVLAVLAIFIYRGAKKGAVGVIISAVTAVAAFAAAFVLSGTVSENIYGSFIKEQISGYIDSNIQTAVGGEMIPGLSETDMSKALIKDTPLADIELSFDDNGKAKLDLSSVDLTDTGLQEADLSTFGINADFDYSNVRAGIITVTQDELEKYGLGNIVLARIIAANLASDKIESALAGLGDKMSGTFSSGLRSFGKDLATGSSDAVYTVVITMISAATADYGATIMDNIVTPMVLPPLKIIVFLLIFAAVALILTLIANVSKIINHIPVISSANGIIGAILGLVEAVIVLLIMCLVLKFLITVCADQLVFINSTTVEKTFIFRHIYALDPMSLFGQAG